ncbi:MAG: hypothetical protein MAG431_01667 [Chloroflexi bacterium]|nr:hypothetical protein [Chloroflexota bacterium]
MAYCARAPHRSPCKLKRLWSRVVQCNMTAFPVRAWIRVLKARALMRGLATGLVATLKASKGNPSRDSRAAKSGLASGLAGGTTSTVRVKVWFDMVRAKTALAQPAPAPSIPSQRDSGG